MRSTSVRRRSGSTAGIESLEGRQLLSTSALFILSTGELDINLGSSDSVQVNAQSGNAQIKEKAADGSFIPISSLGLLPASAVRSIVIVGGDNANSIDLNGLTADVFTALPTISVDAGNGNDTI